MYMSLRHHLSREQEETSCIIDCITLNSSYIATNTAYIIFMPTKLIQFNDIYQAIPMGFMSVMTIEFAHF